MRSLIASGNKVIIVTGTIDDPNKVSIPKLKKSRKEQLLNYGVEEGIHYHEIHPAIGTSGGGVAVSKASICKDNQVVAIWDDTLGYCNEIRRLCPTTMICHLQPLAIQQTFPTEIQRVADSLKWPVLPVSSKHIDERVAALSENYDLKGKRVLEPGCFDGFLTAALIWKGAEVTSFDVRPMNVIRSLIRAEVHNLPFDVRLDKVENIGSYNSANYDLLFHSGLFYHLPDPIAHFEQLTSYNTIALDTHTSPQKEAEVGGYGGRWKKEYGWNDPLSGIYEESFWLTKPELERLFKDNGFKFTELINTPKAINGPRSFYLLVRK